MCIDPGFRYNAPKNSILPEEAAVVIQDIVSSLQRP